MHYPCITDALPMQYPCNIHATSMGQLNEISYFCYPFKRNADVAKLADALDLGSSAARHVGSTPSIRTIVISYQ